MTRRKSEYRETTYDRLMHAAGDHMDEDALRELKKYQEIVKKGHTPVIKQNGYGNWLVSDLDDAPLRSAQK
jgi:hypothetical protein